jgi:hypothetical protein
MNIHKEAKDKTLFVMDVIMFITWALKLLFMQIPYILIGFVVLFLIVSPVSASLNKISADSPVFIGETNVDISSGLNGCHTIAWWKPGADINAAAPDKSILTYPINTPSTPISHFNISRDLFGGATGTWYCADLKPYYPAFEVEEPWINISVWDLDNNKDVTGQSIPFGTNITYKVNTNLYKALLTKNRPNRNPDDSPFSVSLTNPLGKNVPGIYTGSIGKANAIILPFDSKPYITEPSYTWSSGADWDHRAKNLQGDTVYPDGTYSFVVTQNLNQMQDSYPGGLDGVTTKTALVALQKDVFVPSVTEQVATVATQSTAIPTLSATVSAPAPSGQVTSLPTSTPVPRKTTYQPLPAWLGIAGLLIACIFIIRKRA